MTIQHSVRADYDEAIAKSIHDFRGICGERCFGRYHGLAMTMSGIKEKPGHNTSFVLVNVERQETFLQN